MTNANGIDKMTNKHTPGPWLVAGEDKTFIYALGPSGTNSFWAQVQYAGVDRISKEEAIANARLIAAAPETAAERDRLKEINAELLEALKFAADSLDIRCAGSGAALRAAIDKATGQSLQDLADIGQELNV